MEDRVDTHQLVKGFLERGYTIAPNIVSDDEVKALNEHFETMHREQVPGRYEHPPVGEEHDDVLAVYPRVMNPHRFSELARAYMVDPRIAAILRAIFGEEALGVQTMMYFKPPGSRGQKMHQDQFYLQVTPGTCVAVWIALDHVDQKNGGLIVVPHTDTLPIDCRNVGKPGSYDPDGEPIAIPAGYKGECPTLEPGDALIFHGSLIHGSGSNGTTDRWRRSFISHYVAESCSTISKYYHPLVAMDGADVDRGVTVGGGPCGGYVGAAH